jgi:hypothetical protein
MIISKFFPKRDMFFTPLDAVKAWKFTTVPGDPDPRYLIWKSINKTGGAEFIWRQYNYMADRIIYDPITGISDMEVNIIKKYVKLDNYGVVMHVITNKGFDHWVALSGKSIMGWAANDPAGGVRRWAIPFPYKRIVGWALITKQK